jgi:hypothetical protein
MSFHPLSLRSDLVKEPYAVPRAARRRAAYRNKPRSVDEDNNDKEMCGTFFALIMKNKMVLSWLLCSPVISNPPLPLRPPAEVFDRYDSASADCVTGVASPL